MLRRRRRSPCTSGPVRIYREGVFLFGVVNASPDSLNSDSIATTADAALTRAHQLLADGANGIDVGGQGSTDAATVVGAAAEWDRVADIIPALATVGVPLSIDTWQPAVAEQALTAGATILNAADGMQHQEMWDVAARHEVDVVIPFLSGPNPRAMTHVRADPIATMLQFFGERLRTAERYGMADRCILDPGTGFAPPEWAWAERFEYQKDVYSRLGQLRSLNRPLYIALPWKDTPAHDELLEIVVSQEPEYGRVHYPAKVRACEARLAAQ